MVKSIVTNGGGGCLSTPCQGSENGYTQLMSAIISRNEEDAIKLIDAGADLNIQDIDGRTALMHAIKYMPVVAKELIDAGVDLNIQDKNGNTALLHVIFTNNTEVAKKLIDAGADLNKQYVGGLTALMYAIKFGNEEVAKELIEAGADLNIQDIEGQTALMHAINMPDIIKFIIDTVINHVNHVKRLNSDTYVIDFIVSNNLVNEMRKETLDMDIKRQFARPILAYTYSFHKFKQVMLDGMNLKRSRENKSIYSYSLDGPLSIVKSYISPEIYMYLKPDEEIEQIKNAYNYSNQNSSVTADEMDEYIERIIADDNSKKSGGKKRKTKKGKRGNKSKESRKGKKSRKERKSRKGKRNKR